MNAAAFEPLLEQIMAVEIARYGTIAQYPEETLRSGRRPLLQYPASALEISMTAARGIGVALRDSVSGRIIAYALGSPLENYDEAGVHSDPHHGEGNTFYLQAMAIVPAVKNQTEIQAIVLDELRARVVALGYEYLSALTETFVLDTGPVWVRAAAKLKSIPDYLGSGIPFGYWQARLREWAPLEPPESAPSSS